MISISTAFFMAAGVDCYYRNCRVFLSYSQSSTTWYHIRTRDQVTKQRKPPTQCNVTPAG